MLFWHRCFQGSTDDERRKGRHEHFRKCRGGSIRDSIGSGFDRGFIRDGSIRNSIGSGFDRGFIRGGSIRNSIGGGFDRGFVCSACIRNTGTGGIAVRNSGIG
jgi:hypothetical protein